MIDRITRTPTPRLRSLAALHIAATMLAALLAAPPAATAGDDALYGPEAPPGSAFIRIFNATDQADLNVQVGSKPVPDVEAWEVSDFEFLPPGTHQLSAGAVTQNVSLQPNRFYTAVVTGEGVRLLDNQPYKNRLKALVILYNLTDADAVSLRTTDGRSTVIDGVAADASGTREVNPARVPLAVFRGDQQLGQAPSVSFTRGKAYSLFAVGRASAPRLVWAVN